MGNMGMFHFKFNGWGLSGIFFVFTNFHTFFMSHNNSVSGTIAGRRQLPQSTGSPRPAHPRGRTPRPTTSQ
jgi:hypothetical protein